MTTPPAASRANPKAPFNPTTPAASTATALPYIRSTFPSAAPYFTATAVPPASTVASTAPPVRLHSTRTVPLTATPLTPASEPVPLPASA